MLVGHTGWQTLQSAFFNTSTVAQNYHRCRYWSHAGNNRGTTADWFWFNKWIRIWFSANSQHTSLIMSPVCVLFLYSSDTVSLIVFWVKNAIHLFACSLKPESIDCVKAHNEEWIGREQTKTPAPLSQMSQWLTGSLLFNSTHMQLFQALPFPIFLHHWGGVLLRVQSFPLVHWHFFAGSGGCDQSVCVVKWGMECLFKLIVSCSEALSNQWHDSPDPWDWKCDLSTVPSKISTQPILKVPSDNPWLSSTQFIIHSIVEAWFTASNRYASVAF